MGLRGNQVNDVVGEHILGRGTACRALQEFRFIGFAKSIGLALHFYRQLMILRIISVNLIVHSKELLRWHRSD